MSATKPYHLTENDNGKELKLHPGDQVRITLRGNPSTGYQWELTDWNEQILTMTTEPSYTQDSPAIGSGGEFVFEFQAVMNGHTDLRLVYRRPWEKNTFPTDHFDLSIEVTPLKSSEP